MPARTSSGVPASAIVWTTRSLIAAAEGVERPRVRGGAAGARSEGGADRGDVVAHPRQGPRRVDVVVARAPRRRHRAEAEPEAAAGELLHRGGGAGRRDGCPRPG